jgi:fatty acid amide hydrolase 2
MLTSMHEPGESELLQLPAMELAAAIRNGVVTPREVVDVHIACAERVNGRINALVADRFEDARREADAALRELRASGDPDLLADSKPLLGVPFTVKEMIAVEGMPMTFGCRSRLGHRATRDASVVERLRRAGAIPLGVSNMPEWGMWVETYNGVYGRTNNPHDIRRTAGGSSGGEGALVAAGASAFGIGSDIGGSVRMPAAFCGTFGHKPSNGLLPLTGHYPVHADGVEDAGSARPRSPYLAIGPLTRSARDIMPLLRVMAGPDGSDPNTDELALDDPGAVSWRGRRVLLLPAPAIRRTRRAATDLRVAVRDAGTVLEGLGAAVEEAPADLLAAAGDSWFAALQSVGGPGFAASLASGGQFRLLPELAAAVAGRGRYSWPALFFCIAERVGTRNPASLERALAEGRRLGRRYDELVGGDGVLIAPVHPRPAPRHNEPVLFPFDFLYTAVFNALRVPVTVVPTGFDAARLPLAVQVAARRGNDHLTVAAALALEAAGPAWRPAGGA